MITSWVKEHQKKFDFVIKMVVQEEQRGTADALQSARNLLGDASFLLMNGDDLFFAEDIKKLLASKSEHAVLVHPVAKPEQYGIVLINPRDKKLVKAIVEKPQKPIGNLASTGCYVFFHSFLASGMWNFFCAENLNCLISSTFIATAVKWDLCRQNTGFLSPIPGIC